MLFHYSGLLFESFTITNGMDSFLVNVNNLFIANYTLEGEGSVLTFSNLDVNISNFLATYLNFYQTRLINIFNEFSKEIRISNFHLSNFNS